MKLFNMIFILIGATSAIRLRYVGQNSEMYLELARKYSYNRMMKNLSLKQRITIMQKIKNEKTANLRAEIAKAIQENSKMQDGQASVRIPRRKGIRSRCNESIQKLS